MNYIVTLLPGTGIGASFIGIIGALYYLKENNIDTVLLINYFFAAEPVKEFIKSFLDKDNIIIVKFVSICDNYYKKIYTIGDKYKELCFVEETISICYKLQSSEIDFTIFIDLFNKIWILKPFIEEECIKLETYDICINIRRGDKLTLESHIPIASIDSYINEIEKLNLKKPNIFHTSDDYDSFLEIQNKKIDWKLSTLCSTEEKGYFLSELNKQNSDYNFKHVNKFMKQLHIMKNSEYFIGTLSTNVGFIVQLLRQIRNDNKNVYI